MQDTIISTAYAAFDDVAYICQRYNPDGFPAIKKMVEEKRQSPSASIMVYGVYNSGKSTLINALLGEEDCAKVADRPETDKINRYRWREYEILDTPGIDAPIQHEAVTREQLFSANVVVFVVNPLGVVEEAKTLEALLELIERKKKVFMVLNCKNSLEPDDAERIKNELRERIQFLAQKKQLSHVLTDIPILEVNAKTALKAKIENKSNLLQGSGFPRLEADLNKFLNSVDDKEVSSSFVAELVAFLQNTIINIDAKAANQTISKIDNFFEETNKRQLTLRGVLKELIAAKSSFIERRAFSIISVNPEAAQNEVESLVQIANTEIFSELEVELNKLAFDTARLLNTMQESVSLSETGTVHSAKSIVVSSENVINTSIEASDIDPQKLQIGIQQAVAVVKPEHLVKAMEIGKDLIPLVFKGIGPVTMKKIAETILVKTMPIVNAIFTVWQVGKSLFGTDPDEARIRNEVLQRELAEERRNEAIRDACESLAWEFGVAITKAVNDNIQICFTQINNSLTKIRESLGAEQQTISLDRARVVQAFETLKIYA